MKTIRISLAVVAVVAALIALPCVAAYLLLGPIHDYHAVRNTTYSSGFSSERFSQVAAGLPRNEVVAMLGEPLQSRTLADYPVWALPDGEVRRSYDTNSKVKIETLAFSQSRNGGDHEMVSVWIGPNSKVIRQEKWITD